MVLLKKNITYLKKAIVGLYLSCAIGDSKVRDDAEVINGSIVKGRAIIEDSASIENSVVGGSCRVSGYCSIIDSECYGGSVRGSYLTVRNSYIFDNCFIEGYSRIEGSVVMDHAKIIGGPMIRFSSIAGSSTVIDRTVVVDCRLKDNVKVIGGSQMSGADLSRDAIIKSNRSFRVFKGIDGLNITWTKSNNLYKVGEFIGIRDELEKENYFKKLNIQ